MPDQRSVMKEFRFLDAKRSAGGLTPSEELRYAELRELVSPELGAGGAPRGFDVDAAVARLRESLLPAGLRNRPPPTPVAEPSPVFPEALSATDALSSAFEAQPFAELDGSAQQEALFDPASLDDELGTAAWDPNAQAYDPAQPYDPNLQAYDPAQPYDPNLHAYDPAQPYDPNLHAYDPSQPYDPNLHAYDPAQPYDPNLHAYDPAQPYDPNLHAYDPSQPYDPNLHAYDPSQPYDPNLHAYDPAQPYDPNAELFDPGQLLDGSADGQAPADPHARSAPFYESSQPWDPGAATCEAAPYDPGALLANGAQPGDLVAHAAAMPEHSSGFELEPAAPAGDASGDDRLDAGAWEHARAPSIDAAAEQLAEGELEPLPEGELLSDEEPGAPAFHSDASPLPPAGWDVEPPRPERPSVDGFGEYDESGSSLPPAEDAGLESMLPLDPAAPTYASEDVREGFGAALGEYDDTAGLVAPYVDPAPPDLASDASGFQAAQAVALAERGGWDPDAALDAAPADDDFRLESDGSFEATAATPGPFADAASPAEPAAADAGTPELSPSEPDEFSVDVDDGGACDEAGAPAELALEGEEDLPTIDGDDILEEIVEDIADEGPAGAAVHVSEAPGLAPPARPEPPRAVTGPGPLDAALAPRSEGTPVGGVPESRIDGAHRVVVHTVEGQVRRGVLEAADLEAPSLALHLQPGAAPEWIETDTVKAVFFMLAAGDRPPTPEGKRVRVTFADGRQIAGFSPEYREDRAGFFMIPADTRTNTGRIWVYRAAVRQVSVS
jgi:hypothetical protein